MAGIESTAANIEGVPAGDGVCQLIGESLGVNIVNHL